MNTETFYVFMILFKHFLSWQQDKIGTFSCMKQFMMVMLHANQVLQIAHNFFIWYFGLHLCFWVRKFLCNFLFWLFWISSRQITLMKTIHLEFSLYFKKITEKDGLKWLQNITVKKYKLKDCSIFCWFWNNLLDWEKMNLWKSMKRSWDKIRKSLKKKSKKV